MLNLRNLPFPSLNLLFVALIFAAVATAVQSISSDKFALLRFKSFITEDPLGFLSDWNPNDKDPCSWNGVTCDSLSGRVIALQLSGNLNCSVSVTSGNPNSNHSRISFACLGFLSSEFELSETNSSKLKGKLSPTIGDLTELRVLSLGFNGFFGIVPFEIGKLRFLEVLDLGFNGFEGEIPGSIANCVKLQEVSFAGNRLNGTIPVFLAGFQNLRLVSLSFNLFEGPVPEEFGENCRVLEHLHLAGNSLSGAIPSNLGNCTRLRSLILYSNMLVNEIPSNLGELKMLEALDLSRNFLSGVLPSELGNCEQLKVLVLKNGFVPWLLRNNSSSSLNTEDFNFFKGEIPDNVVRLPNLRVLWAPNLNLEGTLPQNWSSCSNLQMVNLAQNYFVGEIPPSLGNCKSLYFLKLSSNNLTGMLPEEISLPCMVVFNVSGNLLSGDIPRFSHNGCSGMPLNLSQLQLDLPGVYTSFFYSSSLLSTFFSLHSSSSLAISHDFSKNQFTGPVPPMLIASNRIAGQPSYGFWFNGNNLEGNMSVYSFDLCQNLESLIFDIGNNRITGELPSGMGSRCKCMKHLDFAGNKLVGKIPLSFAYLDSLVNLDLSGNKLQGLIPSYFARMKDLRYLSLSRNNFTGEIPRDLAQLTSLEVLELSSNSLSGEIPPNFAGLEHLTILQLDHNHLSGQIPPNYGNRTSLLVFNVSFNNLSGSVPLNSNSIKCEDIQGNPNLQPCHTNPSSSAWEQQHSGNASQPPYNTTGGTPRHGNMFNSIEIASIISASCIVFVLICLIFLLVCMRKFIPRSTSGQGASGRKEVVTCNNIGVQLTYENVVRATGSFNGQNCIGSGGFGATYKAEITPGVVVAVKRLSVGRFQGVQQFAAEIRTLGRVQHPNLVTLIGYHVSETEMFLIYNYLPGGNLEKFIQERSKRSVEWSMLHKIALDIARALAYLHDECVPRVLHRDIKPSNILLDNNFNAYLSDFGLARLLGTSETHATTDVAGTFGYVAPEYAMTCRVSDKADVYSYGIVLLELISDKKALDPSFSSYGNGFNIVAWALMLLQQGRASEFFIAGLWDSGPHDDLIETLHLAVRCTVESLSTRPSMKQVAQRLKRIQPPTC